ncbi:DNA topoisomerase 2 [Basidiobolus ranarum]|uniref:DNA topoisomerase 2 n=1 Tax=Basidiobolus ranarum TaxID=34480 RepID=A0ABR2X4G1_9FUNG
MPASLFEPRNKLARTEDPLTHKMVKAKSVPPRKTLEDIYQKKTQLEHILLRPDTYIGSAEATEMSLWVYSTEAQCIVTKRMNIVPGFYKIFDEILVNAADNKIRDPNMNVIKVNIDKENNSISIYNNGKGIPIEMHTKEKVYIPELIFGHLLTSSNYDDHEKKVTGGRNGYGAKLCNIYSSQFIVETGCKQTGQVYKQTFGNNMSRIEKPSITKGNKADFTKITFKPDLAKFGMTTIDDNHESLLIKRVYDIAGCLRGTVRVYFNDKLVPIKNFKDYVKLYLKDTNELDESGTKNPQVVYEKIETGTEGRWEICFTQSEGQFQQVSFVNNISTAKGGTHVQYIADQIVNKLAEYIKAKNKGVPVKKFQIKNQCWVFINCLIENPTFDSQTKEHLTLRPNNFGSRPVISSGFMNRIINQTNVVENIVDFAHVKEVRLLKKSDGQKRSRISGINKLDDANFAGTKKARECTLILTEGDSAKALAVSGLSIVGRDYFGVFPLRGKLLNVREASHKQIYDNVEINHVKKILGLQHGKEYHSLESLRYGHLMIMTDQDHDGSHIKGLIINFIDHFWPTLLKIPGFLREFITPIVRVKKGQNDISFFTIPEYEAWKESNNNGIGWNIKYYKGLGTSTASDAKMYFAALEYHRKNFAKAGPEDRVLIDMAFNKKKADNRKEWLRNFKIGTYMDHSVPQIEISDFINRELILFSIADNIRSIPSLVDGLKPGHRKILFSCFKRNLKTEIKVQQLAGYVSENSAYHHGEQSLCTTIVGLAQDFVGSNNLNLLEPNGQFGTRIQGGKDAASSRYIFTSLPSITRRIFHPDDEQLLTYLNDDGQNIEPQWYIPILPMLLVNGGEGIGTGWSSMIPNYNPLDIVENLKRRMRGEDLVKMIPWYRGFQGTIIPISNEKYQTSGIITKLSPTTIDITELPIRSWTQSYKDYLESLLAERDKGEPFIKDYKEYHTHSSVHFTIELSEEKMREAEAVGLEKKFKITNYISTSNMVCFDKDLKIKKYQSPEEIIEEFFEVRLIYYVKRKEWLLSQLNQKKEDLENKARFIREITNGTLRVQNRKKAEILVELKEKGYRSVVKMKENRSDETQKDDMAIDSEVTDYNYLLGMPIWSLTKEKIDYFLEEITKKRHEIKILEEKTPTDLWESDLEDFIVEWQTSIDEFCKNMENIKDDEKESKKKKPKSIPIKRKGRKINHSKFVRKIESDVESIDEFKSDITRSEINTKQILDKSGTNALEDRLASNNEDEILSPNVTKRKENSSISMKSKQRKIIDMMSNKTSPLPSFGVSDNNFPKKKSGKLDIQEGDVKITTKVKPIVTSFEDLKNNHPVLNIMVTASEICSPIAKAKSEQSDIENYPLSNKHLFRQRSTLTNKVANKEIPISKRSRTSGIVDKLSRRVIPKETPKDTAAISPSLKRQRLTYSTPRKRNKIHAITYSKKKSPPETFIKQTLTRSSSRVKRQVNFCELDTNSTGRDESDVSEFGE